MAFLGYLCFMSLVAPRDQQMFDIGSQAYSDLVLLYYSTSDLTDTVVTSVSQISTRKAN